MYLAFGPQHRVRLNSRLLDFFSLIFSFVLSLLEKPVMDNIVEVTKVISIGMLIATFLLSTNRVLKAIELLKECLILLNTQASEKENEFVRFIFKVLYSKLFKEYRLINDHTNAIKCGRKLLVLLRESGERAVEGHVTFELAGLYARQAKYNEAKKLYANALSFTIATGRKQGEASCCSNLGMVFHSLGKYAKAEEHLDKALAITKEIGDIIGEASCYANLGTVFASIGEYAKAKEHLDKALAIRIEIGDINGEASCYANLGTVFESLGEYAKAKQHFEKALAMSKEIGEINGEASCYAHLGRVFDCLGEYAKAKEHFEKALAMSREIGDLNGEAACYGNLGLVFHSLGEYAIAKEHLEKGLAITKEIGKKNGEALCYSYLGLVFQSLREYAKAKEHLDKALAISKEIGDINGEEICYANLGTVFHSLGEYAKAKEHLDKALAISKETGHINGEATCYENLGVVFQYLGEYDKAKEHLRKGLLLHKEIGNIKAEVQTHANLGFIMLLDGNMLGAKSHLFDSIHKSEKMRYFLRDNDQFKISLFDEHVNCYRLLSALFLSTGKPNEALYTVELGRARALADLMSAQYSLEKEISVNPQTWIGIERIMDKESNSTCLYISYYKDAILLWIVKADKPILFRKRNVNDCFSNKGKDLHVEKIFGNEICRKFHFSPREQCEDRSWFSSNVTHPTSNSSQEDTAEAARLVEEEEDENQQPDPNFAECYKMIIAPVADLLDEAEIIIVPDRSLFKVPFAALEDESGKFLSENFRIRIAPSLTTLKLIQDSPADYHSQTGALIVGDPYVGEVLYKGRREEPLPLPCAREEAEMIGGLLGVQPLLGKQATKQSVLQRIHSVSLIHIAAHGNAERGEIVLSPQRPTDDSRFPREEDYLLTMTEISQARLRAKLVVLSCCHSASGHIRAEGVVGIARAFLGSGARSVLVALWAIEDLATKQFMSRFYEHLVRGENASESLHQAMKWMRSNGFSKVGQWAPFMLIEDNVRFEFNKLRLVEIV